jgi:hypothetical protein
MDRKAIESKNILFSNFPSFYDKFTKILSQQQSAEVKFKFTHAVMFRMRKKIKCEFLEITMTKCDLPLLMSLNLLLLSSALHYNLENN